MMGNVSLGFTTFAYDSGYDDDACSGGYEGGDDDGVHDGDGYDDDDDDGDDGDHDDVGGRDYVGKDVDADGARAIAPFALAVAGPFGWTPRLGIFNQRLLASACSFVCLSSVIIFDIARFLALFP